MRAAFVSFAKAALLAAGAILSCTTASAAVQRWGVDMHPITNPTFYPVAQWDAMLAAMQSRNITHARIDVPLQPWTDPFIVTKMGAFVDLAASYGITVEPVLMMPFAAGDRTDNGKYPAGDRDALYQQGYNRVMAFVPYFRDRVTDWELGNEINLLNLVNGSPLWGRGMTASEFDTTTMGDWAALLRGMSDAIAAINAQYGTNLRRVVGTTGSMFGFIDYMQQKGVGIDVLGYHYYEPLGANPNYAWLAASANTYNVFSKMATYNIPVHLNETNCAEIYYSSYYPTADNTTYGTCLKSLYATLGYFANQTQANIENIDAYELVDEDNMTTPENFFGIYYNLKYPRSQAYILELYAGGQLTATEQAILASKNLTSN